MNFCCILVGKEILVHERLGDIFRKYWVPFLGGKGTYLGKKGENVIFDVKF